MDNCMLYQIKLNREHVRNIAATYLTLIDFVNFCHETSVEIPTDDLEELASTMNYIIENLEAVNENDAESNAI